MSGQMLRTYSLAISWIALRLYLVEFSDTLAFGVHHNYPVAKPLLTQQNGRHCDADADDFTRRIAVFLGKAEHVFYQTAVEVDLHLGSTILVFVLLNRFNSLTKMQLPGRRVALLNDWRLGQTSKSPDKISCMLFSPAKDWFGGNCTEKSAYTDLQQASTAGRFVHLIYLLFIICTFG